MRYHILSERLRTQSLVFLSIQQLYFLRQLSYLRWVVEKIKKPPYFGDFFIRWIRKNEIKFHLISACSEFLFYFNIFTKRRYFSGIPKIYRGVHNATFSTCVSARRGAAGNRAGG